MIRTLILIGIGGGLGSISRYLTSLVVNRQFSDVFPLATLTVNLIGCFIIGLLMGLFGRQAWTSPDFHYLFAVGFCGGYTTFSTFALENINLLQSNQALVAIAYIGFSVAGGLLATWTGLWMMR